MTLVVVRLSALAKNVPQRNRAGFRFTHLPAVADVTPEQLEVIKNDRYLKICNFPSVAWFEAMGIERTLENEQKYMDKNGEYDPPKKMPKTARDAELTAGPVAAPESVAPAADGSGQAPAANVAPSAPAAPAGQAPGKPVELSASSPKEDIIAALERKRQVEGKDFSKDATPEALFTLLRKL